MESEQLINVFVLSIKVNTVCGLRQHRQMETPVCGRNTAIYPSTAKGSRQDIWHRLTENEWAVAFNNFSVSTILAILNALDKPAQ